MYGKHFASLYQGSMVGSGAIVFAVWGYVIANAKPDREVGTQVEINPKLLAAILGESEPDVMKAIGFLCSPDPNSTSREEDGRRMVKIGAFSYRVVNGAKYRAIRDEEQRRQQLRDSQARHREKKRKKPSKPLPGETNYVRTVETHGQEVADAIQDATTLHQPEEKDDCPL